VIGDRLLSYLQAQLLPLNPQLKIDLSAEVVEFHLYRKQLIAGY
jgi:hypothetical protein